MKNGGGEKKGKGEGEKRANMGAFWYKLSKITYTDRIDDFCLID